MVAIGQAGNLSVLTSVFLLLLAIGLLITSADFFIEGAKNLARTVGIPEVVIGLTIVSIGTSLPEILVTTTASSIPAPTLTSRASLSGTSTVRSSHRLRSCLESSFSCVRWTSNRIG